MWQAPNSELITEFIKVKGINLAYHDVGSGNAVVFVHGNFASKRWFDYQLNQLAHLHTSPLTQNLKRQAPEKWRFIALDLPNFGESDAMPDAISIGAYSSYLKEFLDMLGLEKVVLVGHSLGGAVIQVFAARHPKHLAGLMLLNSAPPEGMKTPEMGYAQFELFKTNRDLLSRALAATMPSSQPSFFSAVVDDALQMNTTAFTANAKALENYDVSAHLAKVNCPVWVVRGQLDYLITEAMAQQSLAAFPHASYKSLTGLGHSPQLEAPDHFWRLLASFLEELAF